MASPTGFMVVAVALAACSVTCLAAPRYDDDGKVAVDREMQAWRDLAGPLLQILRANGDLSPICHHKRNSEIINSLLGLPKTMTEAGRK